MKRFLITLLVLAALGAGAEAYMVNYTPAEKDKDGKPVPQAINQTKKAVLVETKKSTQAASGNKASGSAASAVKSAGSASAPKAAPSSGNTAAKASSGISGAKDSPATAAPKAPDYTRQLTGAQNALDNVKDRAKK